MRPLRVLLISTHYPTRLFPRMGELTARQTDYLARTTDVEIQIVAPVAQWPFPLSLGRPSELAGQAARWNDLLVHRPTFPVIPKMRHLDARLLARRLIPVVHQIRTHFPFDIIAAQYSWPDGPAAMHLSRVFGVPFSIKARGPDLLSSARSPSKRKQMVRAANAAGGLLAVSAGLKDEMTALGMPSGRIEVHYTGADTEQFNPRGRADAKAALGLSGPVLLIAGNISPRKGQVRAIEALKLVPDATLLVAGRGPDQVRLEHRIRELDLGHRVRLLGLVDHAQMPALNKAADVAVLPTTAEGLANVWVDALCCGTPVVTTDVCGAREAISRPEAGRIVDNDPAAIASAICGILAHPPAPDTVALAGQRFSWDRNAHQLRAHLERLTLANRA